MNLYPELEAYFTARAAETDQIPADRKARLQPVADLLRKELAKGNSPALIYICTHNSRRSHLGHLLTVALLAKADLNLETYSAGTEATAMHPNTVSVLREIGFLVDGDTSQPNPRYQVRFSDEAAPQIAFSKDLEDDSLPKENFLALMTCDEAFEACPIVFGALGRFPLSYKDPKVSDGTPSQTATYRERADQIAREGAWLIQNSR